MFNSLVGIIIAAEKFKKEHPDAVIAYLKKDQSPSDQLRVELNRVLHMEGGREIIEQVQEEALNRLDLLLRQS